MAEETLTIHGVPFTLVRAQRSSVNVYKGQNTFLRIGPKSIVEEHLATHVHLEQFGFPTPKILERGEYNGQSYYTETSLSSPHFGTIFKEDVARSGAIDDAHFDKFITTAKAFLTAQLKTAGSVGSKERVAHAVHLTELCAELPAHAARLVQRFDDAFERMKNLPWVITHGDFNPHNMYVDGVIDFEDSFHCPVGYDGVTALAAIDWFPDEHTFEYFTAYRYSDRQKARYLAMVATLYAEHRIDSDSAADDFAFLRGIWSTAGMQAHPKLQQWRYNRFVKQFLS
ncbi:aminoglycoside phosphotransferase family protein [bacterium]|nr:aminoglycoside phosphotransferase family protein [bacterium]